MDSVMQGCGAGTGADAHGLTPSEIGRGKPRRRRRKHLETVEAGAEKSTGRRLSAEQIVRLAEFLPKSEQALIAARFELGMTIKRIANLTGKRAEHVGRALARAQKRMASPWYAMAATYAHKLPADQALVARACWLEGLGLRQLAARTGHTLHRVRCDLEGARMLLVMAAAVARRESADAVWQAVKRKEIRTD